MNVSFYWNDQIKSTFHSLLSCVGFVQLLKDVWMVIYTVIDVKDKHVYNKYICIYFKIFSYNHT